VEKEMIRIKTPKLKEIIEFPNIIRNVHESSYRLHQILMYVLEMIQRGDSNETIMDVYYYLSSENQGGEK
jgi:hypothetical protein